MKKLFYIAILSILELWQADFIQATGSEIREEASEASNAIASSHIKYRTINYDSDPRTLPNIHNWHVETQENLAVLRPYSPNVNLAKFRIIAIYEEGEERCLDFIPYVFFR